MKRYRVIKMDFDTRVAVLTLGINEGLDKEAMEQLIKNKVEVRLGLIHQFGSLNSEEKLKNFIDLGSLFPSVVALHNKSFRQIRNAFVIGSYYPALTSVCTLGERVLNHLILVLRNYFRNTPEYKKVYRKSSFDNWDLAIDTLKVWDILLPKVAENYRKLAEIRQKAIHFRPEIDKNDRMLALQAIKIMSKIIHEQFSGFGMQPWFIPNIPGKSFIKKKAESKPFIEEIYLPNCALVGPYHRITFERGPMEAVDDYEYEEKEISDNEFAKLIKSER